MSPIGGRTAAPPRRSRPLVWLVALLSSCAIGAGSLAVVMVMSVARHVADAEGEIGGIGEMATLVAEQASDERGFLLTGDRTFVDAFDAKTKRIVGLRDALGGTVSTDEQRAIDAALGPYHRYVGLHQSVVELRGAGRTDDAVALSFGPAANALQDARAKFDAARKVVVENSDRELSAAHRDGLLLSLVLVLLGFVPGLAAFALSRSQRRLVIEQVAAAEGAQLADAQRIAHMGSWDMNLSTGKTVWSDELFRIAGYEPGEVEASFERFLAMAHPDDIPSVMAAFPGPDKPPQPFSFMVRMTRPDGAEVVGACTGDFVYDAAGHPVRIVGTVLDVTERERTLQELTNSKERLAEQEAEMRHRAHHDSLTGLPNRTLLLERLNDALSGDGGERTAVLLLDLDSFKVINDSLGHETGDDLLSAAAHRLAQSVRHARTDTRGKARVPDTVARLGGDEFAILLHGVTDEAALAVADRVLSELRRPFTLDGRVLSASSSIGVAVAGPGVQASELLRNADVAMYAAKQAGKSRVQLFVPAMHAALMERMAMESALRQAIDNNEFVLHYQPIVESATGTIDTLEALVRWRRDGVLVPPNDFIPLAEETGLIIGLGEWVLTQALRQLASVSDLHPNLKMSVNVSARQLDQHNLPDVVARILAEMGVEPHRLTLEVTESVVMERAEAALDNLDRLRNLGICVSIDDFGTGYSSLSRLRHLPVTELKIDKSFIDEVDRDGTRAPVVAAVVALANNLALDTVAEGVETAEQLEILRNMGCAHLQGFLFSKPLPAHEIEELLSSPAPFASLLPASGTGYKPTSRQAEVMNAVQSSMTGDGTLEGVTRPLLVEVCRMTGMESAYLTRIDEEAGTQEVIHVNNSGKMQVPEGIVIDWDETICKYALNRGPAVSTNVAEDFPECTAARLLGLRTFVTVPVHTSDGSMFGTLCAASREVVPVTPATPHLMEVFARLMADAVERERANPTPPPGAPPPMRVAIAEDSDVVRHLLREALKADGRFDVVAESIRGDEVLPVCRAFRPDVLLLDVELPTVDGLTVLPTVRSESPETAVVVITGSGNPEMTKRAKSAGALAVIEERDAVDVVAAIAEVLGV